VERTGAFPEVMKAIVTPGWGFERLGFEQILRIEEIERNFGKISVYMAREIAGDGCSIIAAFIGYMRIKILLNIWN
jgi:hypothetical protein